MNAENKLLIIDDVYDKGLSLQAVYLELNEKMRKNIPHDIRMATIYFKPERNETYRNKMMYESTYYSNPDVIRKRREQGISMKKIIVFTMCYTLFVIGISAAENTVNVKKNGEYHHGVGVAAGYVTGYGLSYRHLGKKCNLQLTFAPYVQGKDANISVGVALLKDMYIGDTSKLFIYSGIHYWYNRYTEKDDDENEVTLKGEWTDQWLNIGFGPGFEFNLTSNIVFDLMAGYAVYLCDNEATSLNFTGETALFFYFE